MGTKYPWLTKTHDFYFFEELFDFQKNSHKRF